MRYLALAISIAFLSGCGTIASIGTGAGAMPVHQRNEYKSPQQEIYRVDKDRYITLENYKDCEVGGIMKWHDERQNLHVTMSRYKDGRNGFWPGKFSIDPGNERIAVATFGCGDKNCNLWISFSNDGGKTWDEFSSEQYSYYAYKKEDSSRLKAINTEVRVTAEGVIYVIPQHRQFFYRNRLDGTKQQRWDDIQSTGLTDRRCWRGVGESLAEDECEAKNSPNSPLPEGKYDPRNLSSIPNIKSPSGQERFTCDRSLNPAIKAEDD